MGDDPFDSIDPGVTAGTERVPRLVQNLLDKSLALGATDIHIQPSSASLDIFFRVDGVIQSGPALARELAPNVIARLKVLADLLSYRQDIPQEGRMRSGLAPDSYEIRVSSFPTIHGERVAIRLFRREARLMGLGELGLDKAIYQTLQDAIQEKTGAILLTGPGGSGKTTTIYSCLSQIQQQKDNRRHIVTLEDPVEQVIQGISQSEVRPGGEMDFGKGLRSLLRQDPEVIMVGEIRDTETAKVAIEASLSGHLLFSTFHAGSTSGVISRLLEMGIEPHLITSSLRLVMNQRLMRKSCQLCHGEGCGDCRHTGYHGRFLLAEALIPEGEIRKAILRMADRNELEEVFQASGGKTMERHAREAVEGGLTTMEEVCRVLGLEGTKGIREKHGRGLI